MPLLPFTIVPATTSSTSPPSTRRFSGGNLTATPFAGVSRSTNQGANWTLVGGSLPNTNPGKQTENFCLVADPVDPNITYVSGDRGTSNNAGDIFRVQRRRRGKLHQRR